MNGSELIAVWKEGAGLQYWQTSYGRYQSNQGTYTSLYYVRDHLGSARVVLNEAGQRTEATDYYAFGMKMGGRSYYQGTKDGYTTKERDAETGWDYFGARYYNPAIARWNGVDALSDMYPSHSPYNYVMNSPIMMIDPDGNCSKELTGKDNYSGHWGKYYCLFGAVSLGEISTTATIRGGRGGMHHHGDSGELSTFARGRKPVETESSRRHGRAAIATTLEGLSEAFGIIRPPTETELNVWARQMREEAGWEEGDFGTLFFSMYGGAFAGRTGGARGGAVAAGFNARRGLWVLTPRGTIRTLRHGRFGVFFKSKSDGLWWSVDRAGHGGSAFKVFKESRNGLEWIHDANEFGDFIIGKHKGPTGISIPWNQLSGN